jgi:hypothetical protein
MSNQAMTATCCFLGGIAAAALAAPVMAQEVLPRPELICEGAAISHLAWQVRKS